MFSNVFKPTNDLSKYNSKRLPNFVLQFTPYLDNILIKNNFRRHIFFKSHFKVHKLHNQQHAGYINLILNILINAKFLRN